MSHFESVEVTLQRMTYENGVRRENSGDGRLDISQPCSHVGHQLGCNPTHERHILVVDDRMTRTHQRVQNNLTVVVDLQKLLVA